MADIDNRLVRVGIEVAGVMRFYDQLAITASGEKFGNPNQGEAQVSITNLERSVRDYILTETSPFNNNPATKRLTVEVGRVSTGLSLLYVGNIFRSTISQPPDQVLNLKCLTAQFMKGQIAALAFPGRVQLSRIVQQVATDNGLIANFQATDKTVANFNFTGAALKLVEKLQEVGGVNAYVDGENLVVKNDNTPLVGRLRRLSPRTGLVGIPQPTEQGLRATMLYDNRTVLGGAIDLQTNRYPSFNGLYVIYKLGFNIANRDTPFYLTADMRRANP